MDLNNSDVDDLVRMAQEGVEETVSDEVFSGYKFREVIPGCQPHPSDIVESGSLAAIELPPILYPLIDSIPPKVISSGLLSSLQLEGVLYSIAGIILDNYVRGRTKHIWFSISTDLIVDARRDLTDLECFVKVIEGCQQLDKETKALGLSADFKEGVLFCTYATLVSSVNKGGPFSSTKLSRLQQIVDWCGGTEFSGCLVFDECHKAKHFVPGNEQASTKVAVAVCNLQRLLPKARVMYCSATGVSDVKNMAFMERLGLWGDGAAFRSFDDFLTTVQKKGLGVAEMLAMEMKSCGTYLSRSLSFKQAEFTTVELTLSEDQQKMYNIAAHLWNELRKSLISALERTKCSNARVWSSFWAAHQRFFKQLCLGIKVPKIIDEVRTAIDDGYCVVIGLQTTGEASLQSEVNKPGVQQEFVSLCREILTRFIDQNFPTAVEGVVMADGGAVTDEWSSTAKQMLLQFAKKIQLPDSPLDEIIDKLGGPDAVAEMTGRRWRMVRLSSNEQPVLQTRDSSDSAGGLDSLNVKERNLFMSGKKLVAIISDAASTGISLHADTRVGNQRRRIHLTVELAWSADKVVQQLGRSHRSNQTSGPLYKLLTTDLGGEKRFAASVARRLQSLGALTKGDRRAATGADLVEFNFDTPYGRSSLRTMYSAICQKSMIPGVILPSIDECLPDPNIFYAEMLECLIEMDVVEQETLSTSLKIKDKEAGDVGKFLNRILGLSVKRQNLIFKFFMACMDAQVSAAKKEGRYNEGLVDIVASSVQMIGEPRQVFTSKASSLSNPIRHVILNVDRGMSWERALTRLELHPGEHNAFYASRREQNNKRRWLVLATQKEGSSHLFQIARPNTGVSSFDEEKSDLFKKYARISSEEAEVVWKEQYDNSINNCIHGPNCRLGQSCTVGARCYKIHLLCGGIVSLMSLLELTIARYSAALRLNKAECSMRVVRAQLDSGQRIIGVRYPQVLITLAEKTVIQASAMNRAVRSNDSAVSLHLPMPPTTDTAGAIDVDASDPDPSVLLRTVESVSPVIPKYLQKATVPPVTIKQFFKPKLSTTASTSAISAKSSVCIRENVTDTTRSDAHQRSTAKECVSDENCNSITNEPDLKSTNTCTTNMTSTSTKRTSSSTKMIATKKHKQGSIVSLITKNKDFKQQKALKCPICDTTFESSMSNEQFNKHIDSCLIE